MRRQNLFRVQQATLGLCLVLLLLAGSIPALASTSANGAIAGLVTCEGNPVASVVISVVPSGAADPIWTGMTQSNGRYFTDWILPPGTYTVRNYYNLGLCQYAEVTKQATVQATQTTNVDFAGTLCHDLVQNGGFEQTDVWRIGSTPWPARYAAEQHHTDARSMRSGILPAETDRVAESSFYQAVTLPADAANITLGFWYLPFTQETASPPEDWRSLSWFNYSPEAAIAGQVEAASLPTTDVTAWAAYDWQEVLILDQNYGLLEVLQRGSSNAGANGWEYRTYDLTPYRGRTINIYFNTFNNGSGGKRTWMYVDDVTLRTCSQPPACTITPTSRWINLYGLSSTFNGSPLALNQIVRAYDGSGTLAGCFSVRSIGRYGAMPVYADDPDTPADEGLSPGETIRLTIDGRQAIPLGPDAPRWTENGILLQVELAVGGTLTRTLSLNAGWNLISFDVMPADNATTAVLAPIASKFTRVLGSSCAEGALSYYPMLPPEMNTLRTLDPYHGYWIYLSQAAQLPVSGPEVPDSAPVSLCPRWNLVGYLPDSPLPVLSALDSVRRDVQVVLGYDRGALSFYPDLPMGMNTLQTMRPNFGYWIRMGVTGTLTYPPAALNMTAQSVAPQHDDGADDVRPTNRWADAYSLNAELNGKPAPEGSVIEAFDPDGVKIGRFVVKEAGRFGLMPLYGDDPSTPEDEGARAGDRITFTINGRPAKPVRGFVIWRGERTLLEVDLRTQIK